MLTFAVIASRTGRPLDPTVLDRLAAEAAAEVPFAPDRRVTWTNEAGTVWFAGWQPGLRTGPQAPHWHVDADGLTAAAGRVWPRGDGWSGTAPVADQLARHLQRHPLVTEAEELAGIYVVASLARQRSCTVAADPLGIRLLHWGRSREMVVLSTRASVAASLLATATGTTRQRDVLGAGWLAYAGSPLGTRTGYEGITVVPDDAVVEIDPSGAITLHRPPRPMWRLHADELAADPQAALDAARDEMTAAIRTALRYPDTEGRLGLTGGKDSRLVLALLLADGSAADLDYLTSGSDDLPDVVIARQIASAFGLRHHTNPRPGERRGVGQRGGRVSSDGQLTRSTTREIAFRSTSWVTCGSRNVGEPFLAYPPPGNTVLFSGVGGEGLRTNYAATTRMRSKAEVSRYLHQLLGSAGILCEEATAHYRAETHELLFEGASDDDSAQDVLDTFYLRQRLRRWFGSTQELDVQDRVLPLYSITALRLAFGIGAENRHAEWIHRRLMHAACEPLLHLPFANGDWPPGASGDLVPPTKYDDPVPLSPPTVSSPRPRVPFHPPKLHAVRQEGRAMLRATDIEIMRKLFDHDCGNPAFTIIDFRAAQASLDRFGSLSERQRMQVYGALSAVIWLGGREVRPGNA